MENKFGIMDQSMQDIGKMIRLMGKENFSIPRMNIMMDNGKKESGLDMEHTWISTEIYLPDSGKII